MMLSKVKIMGFCILIALGICFVLTLIWMGFFVLYIIIRDWRKHKHDGME